MATPSSSSGARWSLACGVWPNQHFDQEHHCSAEKNQSAGGIATNASSGARCSSPERGRDADREHRHVQNHTNRATASRAGLLATRHCPGASGLSQPTVQRALAWAPAAGLSWPLPDELDATALSTRLFPSVTPASRQRRPNFARVQEQQRKHEHVRLERLWHEYCEQRRPCYSCNQFCALYRRWREASASGRQSHGRSACRATPVTASTTDKPGQGPVPRPCRGIRWDRSAPSAGPSAWNSEPCERQQSQRSQARKKHGEVTRRRSPDRPSRKSASRTSAGLGTGLRVGG